MMLKSFGMKLIKSFSFFLYLAYILRNGKNTSFK